MGKVCVCAIIDLVGKFARCRFVCLFVWPIIHKCAISFANQRRNCENSSIFFSSLIATAGRRECLDFCWCYGYSQYWPWKFQRNDWVSRKHWREVEAGRKTMFLWKWLPANIFAKHLKQQIAFCMYFVYARSYLLHIQVVWKECANGCLVESHVIVTTPRIFLTLWISIYSLFVQRRIHTFLCMHMHIYTTVYRSYIQFQDFELIFSSGFYFQLERSVWNANYLA